MKLLIDSCVPARVAERLRADGHDVETVVNAVSIPAMRRS
ncbi:MAG: DUF5615 family PIN-like protein [Hydrogenophilaceae bacterium]|jgi:predicted nuclease of predicted toxin-antitoxin system|nr:DUF5615 family PIN-like protein [Hydrogenophilaceae bacterium]